MISTILEFVGFVTVVAVLFISVICLIDSFVQIGTNRQQIDLLWDEMNNNNRFIHERIDYISKKIEGESNDNSRID